MTYATQPFVVDPRVERRADELFADRQQKMNARTDRMFAVLMLVQWVAAIAAAIWISPRTWAGSTSQIHLHVYLAVFMGGVLASVPAVLAWRLPGQAVTRYAIALAQMSYSVLLIHITGGRIETHFYVFGSLAFLAVYKDWKLLVAATLVTIADHWIRGHYWPQSVYGVENPGSWRWVEHAGWMIFEDVFLGLSCIYSVQGMRRLALQTAQLEVSNNTTGQFLANISHEIRTPLNGVLGFTKLLLQEAHSTDVARRTEFLQAILLSAEHQLVIINDVLDHAKIAAGRMSVERRPVSPQQIVAEVCSMLRARALEKGLTLESSWNGPIPEMVVTDSARLRQLLMNLVGNAIKFTELGGVQIVCHLEEFEDHRTRLVFDVIDTGIGIPSDRLDAVFQPFIQADSSVTRRYGGTGLGLAISRHIAEALGGTLTAGSTPGEGTIFTATIDPGPLKGIRMIQRTAEPISMPRPVVGSPGTELEFAL